MTPVHRGGFVPPLAEEAREERYVRLAALGRRIRVGLVGCSAKKAPGVHPARSLYRGAFFLRALPIAEATCDETWILSARFALVSLNQELPHYNETLSGRRTERATWGAAVIAALDDAYPGLPLELVFFAGAPYVEGVTGLHQRTGEWLSFNADHFSSSLWTYSRPLHGLDRKGRWTWFRTHAVDAAAASRAAPNPGAFP